MANEQHTYLELNGLNAFWQKIKNYVGGHSYSKEESYNKTELYTKTEIDNKFDGKHFIGTMEEYQAAYAAGQIKVGTIVIIREGKPATGQEETAILGVAVLGKMILGKE